MEYMPPTNSNESNSVYFFLLGWIYLLTFIFKSRFYLFAASGLNVIKVLYQIDFFQNMNYTIHILLMECFNPFIFCSALSYFVIQMCAL